MVTELVAASKNWEVVWEHTLTTFPLMFEDVSDMPKDTLCHPPGEELRMAQGQTFPGRSFYKMSVWAPLV